MGLRTVLAASALAAISGTAPAQIIFTDTGDVTFTALFNPDGGVFAPGAFTGGDLGFFTAGADGMFSLTYLGQESGYSDGVTIVVNGQTLTETSAVGSWITGPMSSGQLLDFKFFASGGDDVTNGGPVVGHSTFSLLGRNVQTQYGSFEYVIGYNDAVHHDDWDDFVVGLNSVPIPEPHIYALMLAGLGVIGWAARRRLA
jgi:hypothetical protein